MAPKVIVTPELIGEVVYLEPLDRSHIPGLRAVADHSEIWIYNSMPGDFNLDRYFAGMIEKQISGEHRIFVVRLNKDDRIVGSTRFYNHDPNHQRVTLGFTWLTPAVWGTAVNRQCKRILLHNAFEHNAINRVAFDVDSRNQRSIAALKSLGIVEEGRLRNHMIVRDNFVRDTVVLSVLKSEWPDVKSRIDRLDTGHRLDPLSD